jgi:hypothetical protein
MSNHLKLDFDDDGMTRGLRELHAPPATESYWSGLEARIMARIADADSAWWSELGRWTRPALVAAAMLVIGAGLLVFRSRDEATQVAYEDVLAAPTPITVRGSARPASLQGVQGEREEVFRYLITY